MRNYYNSFCSIYRYSWILLGSGFFSSVIVAAIIDNKNSKWFLVLAVACLLGAVHPTVRDIKLAREEDRKRQIEWEEKKLKREVPDDQLDR